MTDMLIRDIPDLANAPSTGMCARCRSVGQPEMPEPPVAYVPCKRCGSPVVEHGRPWIGIAGSDLDLGQVNSGMGTGGVKAWRPPNWPSVLLLPR